MSKHMPEKSKSANLSGNKNSGTLRKLNKGLSAGAGMHVPSHPLNQLARRIHTGRQPLADSKMGAAALGRGPPFWLLGGALRDF